MAVLTPPMKHQTTIDFIDMLISQINLYEDRINEYHNTREDIMNQINSINEFSTLVESKISDELIHMENKMNYSDTAYYAWCRISYWNIERLRKCYNNLTILDLDIESVYSQYDQFVAEWVH